MFVNSITTYTMVYLPWCSESSGPVCSPTSCSSCRYPLPQGRECPRGISRWSQICTSTRGLLTRGTTATGPPRPLPSVSAISSWCHDSNTTWGHPRSASAQTTSVSSLCWRCSGDSFPSPVLPVQNKAHVTHFCDWYIESQWIWAHYWFVDINTTI